MTHGKQTALAITWLALCLVMCPLIYLLQRLLRIAMYNSIMRGILHLLAWQFARLKFGTWCSELACANRLGNCTMFIPAFCSQYHTIEVFMQIREVCVSYQSVFTTL